MGSILHKIFVLVISVGFSLTPLCSDAQEAFLEEIVSELLVNEINDLREKEGLNTLVVDETLDAIAFDQAEYILKIGKITHEQEQDKKKTLLDRILYYEGLYAQAGENAVIVGVGSKEQIDINGPRVTINTEANAVKAAIVSWLDEEEGRLNLLDPNFYQLGTAVIITENKEVIFVVVTASLPYLPPNSKKPATNFHGIDTYSEENCKGFLENNPTIPQLFSDAIKVEGKEAFFSYHSLDYMNEIISSSSDGIAIDIIRDNQFKCGVGNRIFPTEINDGYLLPAAKKGKLNAFNSLAEKGEVKLSLGVLPDFYDPSSCELNLILIKKGSYCETVPYNRLETQNTRWFDLPFLLAGKSDTNVYSWNDSSIIEIGVKSGIDYKKELVQQLEFLKEIDYQYNSLAIEIITSPIGLGNIKEDLSLLLEKELSNVPFTITSKVAWDQYGEFQKGTFHQLETEGKDTSAIIEYLKGQNDDDLLKFRDQVNQLKLAITGKASITNTTSQEAKVALLKRLIKDQRIEPAQYIQANLIQGVFYEKIDHKAIPIVDPSQKKHTVPLINNQIVLDQNLGNDTYDGNPIYLAFLELYLINKKQVEVSFNKHVSELKHWSSSSGSIKNFENWAEAFRLLSGSVPSESYARAFLNYQLMAADYYFDKGDFNKRKKAFIEIMKWQQRANLNNDEILNLAKYLCYEDQFSKAIELLKPIVNKEKVDSKLLFYFLQISIYDKENVSIKLYYETLKKAKDLYPQNFCELFAKDKMGKQLLKDYFIKDLYCTHCKN